MWGDPDAPPPPPPERAPAQVGCICVVVSFIWMLHIILYVFVQPPATPMLNDLFISLDGFFPLFGVSFFGLFCFYLIAITIKGNFTLGLNLLFVTIHPMKQNGTLMSSFLFNVGLICMCSVAVIQFCSQAFSLYAAETAIQEIFDVEVRARPPARRRSPGPATARTWGSCAGGSREPPRTCAARPPLTRPPARPVAPQINNLRGIKHMYTDNVFLIMFFIFAGLSFVYLLCAPNKEQRKRRLALEEEL